MKKELPCPHCCQNLNLAARATEALVIAIEALEKLRDENCDIEFVKSALTQIEKLGEGR